MAEVYGVKETKELLVAMGDAAVLVAKAINNAKGADGKLDVQKLAGFIATQLIANPTLVADFKAAAEGISDVPSEIKDLSLTEVFEVVAVAGAIASKCAAEVKAA